ncbi:TetR/AcrR family transcriptional regulator [Stieleria sp. JC731]|uniref:TetR/AcrR family transcriptional regulator n=1 Tax=Pirellulaceae TaxID=2691357 RepID=UPI001E5C0BBA|nr:TetR/AcrR family transcriptional regulator [Stieleria sp. JC731]MCC9603677.1 TetR/AcrR family transcriptional regulator [Stieleria sp. JC731]
MLAVRDLILERGYGGTSVDAICTRAEVSKGSFFHHFKSKEDAACATLDEWMNMMRDRSIKSGYMDQPTAKQKLVGYLNFFATVVESSDSPNGCFLGVLALELSDTHPQVRERAAAYFDAWNESIATLINDAFVNTNATHAKSLADLCIASLEGALLLAKARKDPSIVRDCVHHTRDYIVSLLPDE